MLCLDLAKRRGKKQEECSSSNKKVVVVAAEVDVEAKAIDLLLGVARFFSSSFGEGQSVTLLVHLKARNQSALPSVHLYVRTLLYSCISKDSHLPASHTL